MIQTQRLDRKIEIQKMEKYKNEDFEWVETWVKDREIWCSVKQQYFSDFKESFGTKLEGTTNFIIRFDEKKPVQTNMRVVYNGKPFEIISVLEGSFIRDFTTIVGKLVKE